MKWKNQLFWIKPERDSTSFMYTVLFFYIVTTNSLADPGGAYLARAPPNGRGPMIFYAQNTKFSPFFFARFARDSR